MFLLQFKELHCRVLDFRLMSDSFPWAVLGMSGIIITDWKTNNKTESSNFVIFMLTSSRIIESCLLPILHKCEAHKVQQAEPCQVKYSGWAASRLIHKQTPLSNACIALHTYAVMWHTAHPCSHVIQETVRGSKQEEAATGLRSLKPCLRHDSGKRSTWNLHRSG